MQLPVRPASSQRCTIDALSFALFSLSLQLNAGVSGALSLLYSDWQAQKRGLQTRRAGAEGKSVAHNPWASSVSWAPVGTLGPHLANHFVVHFSPIATVLPVLGLASEWHCIAGYVFCLCLLSSSLTPREHQIVIYWFFAFSVMLNMDHESVAPRLNLHSCSAASGSEDLGQQIANHATPSLSSRTNTACRSRSLVFAIHNIARDKRRDERTHTISDLSETRGSLLAQRPNAPLPESSRMQGLIRVVGNIERSRIPGFTESLERVLGWGRTGS
ncbi:hypothetical protein BDY21DRAFT_56312 [Lineolata rhizophorae]|uniref:Uncharacterized protein n=1 Tax=Lineolata rhizophorae TaxID=578093 RepID=A0A6A6NX80_9PEZI|nr:hypothetical protein BDY21DRAFT_56312 [Lineolata rhizophorae]